MDLILEAKEILAQSGALVNSEVIPDGEIHRLPTVSHPDSLNLAYSLHLDRPPRLNIWNHETGGELKTFSLGGNDSVISEVDCQRVEEAKEQRREKCIEQEIVSIAQAQNLWEQAQEVHESSEHEYLVRKQIQPHGVRKLNNTLIVPVYNIDKQIQTLQFIQQDGKKRFLSGGKASDGFFPIKAPDGKINDPILVAEGFATASSIFEATNFTTLSSFSANNLPKVARIARKIYPSRPIVIAADFDKPSAQYPNAGGVGLVKAQTAARLVHGLLIMPQGLPDGGTDFNDLALAKGLDAVKAQIEAVLQGSCSLSSNFRCDTCDGVTPVENPHQQGISVSHQDEDVGVTNNVGVTLPGGFVLADDTLYAVLDRGDAKPPEEIILGGRLEILARAAGYSDDAYAKLLSWTSPRGKVHRELIHMSLLSGRDTGAWLGNILLHGGYQIGSDKNVPTLLKRYILECSPDKFLTTTNRVGWHGDQFVFPDKTISTGETQEEVYFTSKEAARFSTKGSLEGWQNTIGHIAQGNSRLIFAISAAFASIFLEPCDLESGGFCFVGESGRGKTTILQVASSVWGSGASRKGYMQSWSGTKLSIENIASASCDCLLSLDELGEADARSIGSLVYGLAHGEGRRGCTADAKLREQKTWRTFIMSSGELSLRSIVESAGQSVKEGQESRLVCLPIDVGGEYLSFETIHGCKDSREFSDLLKKHAIQNFGNASIAYIEKFIEHREETIETVEAAMKENLVYLFETQEDYEKADAQVLRIAKRFMLVACAGESAVEWGVLPWRQGEAFDAVRKCFLDWLESRGSLVAGEEARIVGCVESFLLTHGASRFQELNSNEKVINRLGFYKDKDGQRYFYMPSESYNKMLADFRIKFASQVLLKHGMLITDESGKKSISRRLPGTKATIRTYCLTIPGEGGHAGEVA